MKLTNEPDWERLRPVPAMILVAKGPSMLFAMAKKKKLTNINTGCIGTTLFKSELHKLYHHTLVNTTIKQKTILSPPRVLQPEGQRPKPYQRIWAYWDDYNVFVQELRDKQ